MGPGSPENDSRHEHDVFISYSRSADSRLAPAIQRGLSRLAKKWYRVRALTVFRDQTDLSAANSLGGAIEQAIADSRFFLLLASPAAAESSWVREEVETWQRTKKNDRFIIALTDGTIRWDDERGDFDWDSTDALPRCLSGYFDAEPLWQDLTWSRDVTRLSLRHSEFRGAIAAMAAPMHERSRRELDNDDVEAHRRSMVVAGLAMSLILVLTIAFGIVSVVANDQKNRAVRNASDATAISSISRAQAQLADPDAGNEVQAYQWLAAARSIAATPNARADAYQAALQAVYERPNLLSVAEPARNVGVGVIDMTTDGRLGVSAHNGQLRLFDPATGKPAGPTLAPRSTKESDVLAVAFSSDARRVAAAYDTRIVVWDTASGERISEFPKDDMTMSDLTLSPDGNTAAVAGSAPGVRLWDVRTGRQIGTTIGSLGMQVVFSPDGRKIAFDDADDTGSFVRVRDLDSAGSDEIQLARSPDDITSIAFNPNGRSLAVGTENGSLGLWNPESGQPIGPTMSGHSGRINGIAFSPDSRRVATAGDDESIRVWDPAAGIALGYPLTSNVGAIYLVRFTADGKNLISYGDDTTLRRWDALTGFGATGAGASQIAVAPHGKVIASGGHLWNYETGARVGAIPLADGAGGEFAEHASYLPDGTLVAISVRGDEAVVWDGTAARTVQLDPSIDYVTRAAYMPWGNEIVLGSFNGKLVFQNLDGKTTAKIDIGCSPDHIVMSKDGHHLAYSCSDGAELGILNAETGKNLALDWESRITTMAFSPDGRSLIIGDSDGLVWRWTDKSQEFLSIGNHRGQVTTIAYSPDGRWFASAGQDGSIALFPARGTLISARIAAHGNPVTALGFTPNSDYLISIGNTDASTHIYHVYPDPTSALCDRVPHNMSISDWNKWVSSVIGYRDQCRGKQRAP